MYLKKYQLSIFADVLVKHPYAHAIAPATFYGIVCGDKDPDGNPTYTFHPDESINSAEFVKLLVFSMHGNNSTVNTISLL